MNHEILMYLFIGTTILFFLLFVSCCYVLFDQKKRSEKEIRRLTKLTRAYQYLNGKEIND